MSDQRNLLFAVVLSMVVVFGWQYLVGVPKIQEEQAKQAQSLQQQKSAPAAQPGASPGPASVGQAVAGVPREAVLAKSAARASIDTPKLAGSINLTGGRFDDLRLRTYHDLGKTNDTQHFESTGGWLGITDKYWMAAAIPPQSQDFTATYKAYDANGVKAYQSDFTMKSKTVAPNGSQVVIHHLFAGAKVVDLVNEYGSSLGIQRFDMAVDWGWFAMITKPIFQAIDFLYRYVG